MLRALIKPKPNTVWDYLVPFSLVGLAIIAFNYGLMNYEVVEPYKEAQTIKKSLSEIKNFLISEVIYGAVAILTIFFFTRKQRILIVFLFGGATVALLLSLNISLVELNFGFLIFEINLLNIQYLLANLSLLVKYGNNSTVVISKKSGPMGSAMAWGIYGFGLNLLFPVFALFFFGDYIGAPIRHKFIFANLYDPITQLPFGLHLLFLFFMFSLIGYAIEKYRQRRG